MNRRTFALSTLGSVSLLLAGQAVAPTAFARTRENEEAASTDDLTDNVVSSLKRVYDREDPMSFVVAFGFEMDRKRNASAMYENLLAGGVSFFGEIDFEDEFDYGDLADGGHVYTGIIDLGEDAPPVYVAVLYAQIGKYAYAIGTGDLEDPMPLIEDYYDALFDEDREESDILLTEDEMPRGFVISEEGDAFDEGGAEEDPDVTEDDGNDDKDKDEEDAPKKKRSGKLQHHIATAMRMPLASFTTHR